MRGRPKKSFLFIPNKENTVILKYLFYIYHYIFKYVVLDVLELDLGQEFHCTISALFWYIQVTSFVFELVSVRRDYVSLDVLSFSLMSVLSLSLIAVGISSESLVMSMLVFRRKHLDITKHDGKVENFMSNLGFSGGGKTYLLYFPDT